MKKIMLLVFLLVGCESNTPTQIEEVAVSDEVLSEYNYYTDSKTGMTFSVLESENDSYMIGIGEVTNEQYVAFLTEAYHEGSIVYNESTKMVFTIDGYQMIDLSGSRVVKDHNRDGTYSLDEMENPLNRCFIKFDSTTETFYVENPQNVNWEQYFNPELYPGVVDSIVNWPELNAGVGEFYGYGDSDKLLPTLEEVKSWPVNFIKYYGAKEYVDFYGYDLPTREQWIIAAEGGEDFEFATNDGNTTETSAWFNTVAKTPPFPIDKGHVQPSISLDANPYGIYNLGGNVWEWTKEWAEWEQNEMLGVTTGFFIDDERRSPIIDETMSISSTNQYKKSLIGGSFNFFPQTMSVDWEHSAYINAGNDHFGFRVVINN